MQGVYLSLRRNLSNTIGHIEQIKTYCSCNYTIKIPSHKAEASFKIGQENQRIVLKLIL